MTKQARGGVTQPLFEVAVERVRTEGHVEIHPPVECLGSMSAPSQRSPMTEMRNGACLDAFLVDRRRQGQDLFVVEQLLADYRCRRQLDATRRRDGLDDRARMRRAKAPNVHWILTERAWPGSGDRRAARHVAAPACSRLSGWQEDD